MEGDLPSLEVSLTRVETGSEEALDGEVHGSRGVEVDGEVDDTVGACPEDGEELQTTVVEGVTDERRPRGCKGVVRHVVWVGGWF